VIVPSFSSLSTGCDEAVDSILAYAQAFCLPAPFPCQERVFGLYQGEGGYKVDTMPGRAFSNPLQDRKKRKADERTISPYVSREGKLILLCRYTGSRSGRA
jgi:hypothetical protein